MYNLTDINKLAKLGIDKNKLFVAISYEVETMLMQNPTYANTASQLSAEEIREGFSGKINGVRVITQDLGTVAITAKVEGVDVTSHYNIEYMVYGAEWCQAIDEFSVDVTVNRTFPYTGDVVETVVVHLVPNENAIKSGDKLKFMISDADIPRLSSICTD